jgi:hypothetical protein
LFEVILRKRIFLTDRMERIETALVTYGIITESQIKNQASAIGDQEAFTSFVEALRARTSDEQFKL